MSSNINFPMFAQTPTYSKDAPAKRPSSVLMSADDNIEDGFKLTRQTSSNLPGAVVMSSKSDWSTMTAPIGLQTALGAKKATER